MGLPTVCKQDTEKGCVVINNKHEAYYKCGYCGKHTPLEDDDLKKYIEGSHPSLEFKSPCSCGHFSYGSSIRFKAGINPKDWQGWYRGSAE